MSSATVHSLSMLYARRDGYLRSAEQYRQAALNSRGRWVARNLASATLCDAQASACDERIRGLIAASLAPRRNDDTWAPLPVDRRPLSLATA